MTVSLIGTLGMEQGPIKVWASPSGQPHPIQFWVDRAMDNIMSVADTAPQPIRDQAYAFRDQIAQVIKGAMSAAIKDQRAYDVLKIEAISREAAAALRGN